MLTMLRFDARQWEANEAMIEKGLVLPVGRASKLRQKSASHECILWDWWFWLNVVSRCLMLAHEEKLWMDCLFSGKRVDRVWDLGMR